ncbi:uncharacterized protein AB9W97_005255 isoform 2-T2 [Spinachia spinachia]
MVGYAMTEEEEAWFKAYYETMRPRYLDPSDPCDKFFLSVRGKQVSSVTSDLCRLHRCYEVQNATSQEVRRVAETQAGSVFSARQKEGVARNMAHTTSVVQKHYSMLTAEAVVETSVLLGKLSEARQPRGLTSSWCCFL